MLLPEDEELQLLMLLQALIDISKVMGDQQTAQTDRFRDLEGLVLKNYYHASGVLYLYRGTVLPELSQNCVDPASVQILTRAALESALTFDYVFRQPQDDQERQLRYDVWRLTGMLNRHAFAAWTDEGKQKILAEKPMVEQIVKELESNAIWTALPEDRRQEIRRRREWRLPVRTQNGKYKWPHWEDLAKGAGLGVTTFQRTYRFLCGYSHSSYTSAFQLHQAVSVEHRKVLCDPMLGVTATAVALLIRDIAELFESAADILKKEAAYREAVSLWLYIGSGKVLDECTGDANPSR